MVGRALSLFHKTWYIYNDPNDHFCFFFHFLSKFFSGFPSTKPNDMDRKKENLEKEIHQAVILIDNDGDSFAKLSTRPKVLMNLIDRPILQYTFEMLSLSNIDEIFLFCCCWINSKNKTLVLLSSLSSSLKIITIHVRYIPIFCFPLLLLGFCLWISMSLVIW